MGVERRSVRAERARSGQLRLPRGRPRRHRRAAAAGRPAAQGVDRAARPRHGRDHAAARSGSAHLHQGLSRDADRRADGWPRRRGAVHEPHDQRRQQRHRARHRHRAAHGLRVGHVVARDARVPQGRQPVRGRPQPRDERGHGTPRRRRDRKDHPGGLRHRATACSNATACRSRRSPRPFSTRSRSRPTN